MRQMYEWLMRVNKLKPPQAVFEVITIVVGPVVFEQARGFHSEHVLHLLHQINNHFIKPPRSLFEMAFLKLKIKNQNQQTFFKGEL